MYVCMYIYIYIYMYITCYSQDPAATDEPRKEPEGAAARGDPLCLVPAADAAGGGGPKDQGLSKYGQKCYHS